MPVGLARSRLQTLATLVQAGVVRPTRPDRAYAAARALMRFKPTPAAGITASAVRYPDAPAIVDELGTLTFREVHERTNALADSLAKEGIGEGDNVALMCRNHRGFVEVVTACSKLGSSAVLLNTGFSGPQLADVTAREQPAALIFDEEFGEVLLDAGRNRRRFVAWPDPGGRPTEPLVEELIAQGSQADRPPPSRPGKAIILTSGTTGAPKGAARSEPRSLDPAAALLSRIPLRARERTLIAAPLFHSWGFANFTLGLSLSSTFVLPRRFDPAAVLALAEREACTALVVVPVMLQRILELPEATLAGADLSSVRAVPVSGSSLPPSLSEGWMDAFGENLYNLYGSTEVAWASIATPRDLRAAPGTAGTPPRGTVVRLYDEAGRPVSGSGVTGRIFVGNEMRFEGYTGGGSKDVIDGLMSSGDVGHFDERGRLFVDGRDDDMIVSGGENVFPAEVEDLVRFHEGVADVAMFGVDDDRFGQRLSAVVVPKPGARLTAREIQAHVRANLAGYKVPREVRFTDELPRNATGKVLKRSL